MGGIETESLVAALAAVVIAFGGYVQFVLRRSVYPCIEFDLSLSRLPSAAGEVLAELVLEVRNVGPGVGFVDNLQARVGYRLCGESGASGRDRLEPALTRFLEPDDRTRGPRGGRWFLMAPMAEGNFIQPGVTQRYRKPLLLPGDAAVVHAWGAFDYRIEVGRVTWWLARYLAERPRQQLVEYTVRGTFAVIPRVGETDPVPG